MRLLSVTLLGLLALSLIATDAWAHGGQFRGPGGSVPPRMREPHDPTPPPPPPVSPGPPVTPGTPSTGGSNPNPTSTPTPAGTPPITGAPVGGRPRSSRALTYDDFSFWYAHNNSDIEFLKDAIYFGVNTGSILQDAGDRGAGNRPDNTHEIRAKVKSTIIPALLWAMDPKNAGNADVESAAYIALAKVARGPVHIEHVKKGLDLRMNHHNIVMESAALGLGLLRRADPTEQLSASELDRVRAFLFEVFADDEYPTRTRGMAALSIGLLGDQPTGSGTYASDARGAAKATTAQLFEALKSRYSQEDLPIGLLMAIGMQSGDSVDENQRKVLHDCVMRGRLYTLDASELVRSYAALTLGRIGNTSDIPVLRGALLSGRGKSPVIQRSAAIGLGVMSRLVTGADRVAVAESLLASKKRVKDIGARNFAMISLAYCINEDVKANKTDVIDGTQAETYLLEMCEDGKYAERPYGAMATALIVREIGEEADIIAYGELRQQYLDALRSGLTSKKLDTRRRAAFATALGIGRDKRSVKALTEIVADRNGDHQLRGYAALGLGLIGYARKDSLVAIRKAMKERRSEEMRVQCATALGLLRDSEAVNLLLEELQNARSQSVKGQVVLALAKIGDERAVEPMEMLLRNPKEQGLTRALACAGLGVIGDLESIPSLARISKNVNYRAHCDLMAEVLTII